MVIHADFTLTRIPISDFHFYQLRRFDGMRFFDDTVPLIWQIDRLKTFTELITKMGNIIINSSFDIQTQKRTYVLTPGPFSSIKIDYEHHMFYKGSSLEKIEKNLKIHFKSSVFLELTAVIDKNKKKFPSVNSYHTL